MAKKQSKKQKDAALKKGADAINKAKTEPEKPIVIPRATRDISEVLSDRVTVLDGALGIKLAEDTPMEETFQVLDWATQMSDHIGFMVGDIVNFGNTKFGETYKTALNQTGRAYSTLASYAEVSRRIPFDQRSKQLTFSAHRELIRLPDEKIGSAMKEVVEQIGKGKAVGIREIREKVQKLTPKKRKTPKRATSGKGKKKEQKELPPYVPTDEEQSKLDSAEEAIGNAASEIKTSKLFAILGRLDNKEKRRWLTLMEPIAGLYNSLDRVTGY
jgi:hypothetical protein